MATINKIPKCPPLRFPEFNDEWKETSLGELLSFYPTNSYSWDQLDYETGAIYNVHYGLIHKGLPTICSPNKVKLPLIKEDLDVSKYTMCKAGDLIIADASEDTNDVGKAIEIIECEDWEVVAGLHTIHARSKQDTTALGFKGYLFASKNLKGQIRQVAQGSKVYSISAKLLSPLIISLPSLEEQKKIADFLSLIDERIQSCSETLKERKREKAGLLNQLFSQKLRFPDFNDEWTQTTLGEIAERVTRKNNGHITSRPLTISAQYGLIDQRDFFNKIVASTSLEGYYLLNKGEFAYNRSSSADYPWGAIKRLESYENGALSTLYICFSLLQGYPSFIAHFFETSQWHEYIQSIAAEGARNHGLLNISVSDFFALPISLPSLEEQKKIADFLSLIDERIEVEEQLLQQYEKQKRYLLKQMFV